MPDKRTDYPTPFGRFYASLEPGEVAELARKSGVSYQMLWALAAGKRKAGMDSASALIDADERITMAMLRPDKWE